jgi:rare lipoprotein A
MGLASWYDIDAAETANGETMAADALKAAHPSLPLGTRVLVENVENGERVVVRINDRGPFAVDRIIDLPRAAAERLDMVKDGVAMVRGRRIDDALAGTPRPLGTE